MRPFLGFVTFFGFSACVTIENNAPVQPALDAPQEAGVPTALDSDSGANTRDALQEKPSEPVDASQEDASDAGPDATALPVEGTYFASCLSELAGGNVKKTFSFWATTKYTPNVDASTGGTLAITLESLSVEDGNAPKTVSRSNIVSKLPDITGTANGESSFVATTVGGVPASFAGAANPISGSDVTISNAGLKGRFNTAAFCARLFGHVDKPEAASRDLAEGQNQCLFTLITDGAAAPEGRVKGDYAEGNCPL